ncbi:MAG: hypothetical protein V7K64_25570 [Nostoc sp.]|uniref:hypothetical protein n=1 Tax=Nostoc sp. TaxID=1180 RepID=UPI002FFAA705
MTKFLASTHRMESDVYDGLHLKLLINAINLHFLHLELSVQINHNVDHSLYLVVSGALHNPDLLAYLRSLGAKNG